MKKILFIDGMNLAWKAIHAYNLSTSSGQDTSAIFGFINQLISVINGRKDLLIVVAWDGGYEERTRLSNAGIEKGIINAAYKSNRKSDDKTQDTKINLDPQLKEIQRALSHTDIKQIFVAGEEADDVIASCAKKIGGKAEILCLTCDHDYYQLLSDNFSILDRMHGTENLITNKTFTEDKGIEPCQWVDSGALSGDTSDCIMGVPGCGEPTAIKLIKAHGDVESVISHFESELSIERGKYPDLQTQDEVNELISLGGTKKVKGNSQKPNYEGIYVGMPFSGVCLANLRGDLKKVKKIDIKVVMYQERIRLAKQLKKMRSDIDVPNITFESSFNEREFCRICGEYELYSITMKAEVFKFL